MAANQLIGTILTIGATQDLTSKSGNSFKLRDLTIMVRRFDPNTGEPVSDSENTPQLTFMGDRCAELDNFQPGQVVVVSFDVQGRKYTDQAGITKIINDIRPFKIEPYQPRTFAAPQSTSPQTVSPAQPAASPTPAPSPAPQPGVPAPGYHQPRQQPAYPQQGYDQPQSGYKPPF